MRRALPPRIWLSAAVLYLCSLFYLLFQGGKTSLMLFVMLNALIVYLLFGRWSGIRSVHGTRTIILPNAEGAMLTAGMRLQVKLNIQIPGAWPLPYVIVRDHLVRTVSGETQIYETSFVPDYRRRGEIIYETAPLRRGRYRFQTTECSTRDIFGLFEHQGEFAETVDLQVLPRMIAIKDWQMLKRSQRGVYQQTYTSKWAKETTQIDGVREYIHGDRLSRIHWNATAKTGQWKSKEFEREALPRIVILLDCQTEAYASSSQFEVAVSAAASVLEFVRMQGMPIGFVSAGKQQVWLGAGRSPVMQETVLQHLVDVEADGSIPIRHWIAQVAERFEPGVQVVVISPRADASLPGAFQALEARGMIPAQIHVNDVGASDSQTRQLRQWMQLCKARQWECQSITRLEDLLTVLGVSSA
jgi:uncharacterized protein (DUF58 family)